MAVESALVSFLRSGVQQAEAELAELSRRHGPQSGPARRQATALRRLQRRLAEEVRRGDQ